MMPISVYDILAVNQTSQKAFLPFLGMSYEEFYVEICFAHFHSLKEIVLEQHGWIEFSSGII